MNNKFFNFKKIILTVAIVIIPASSLAASDTIKHAVIYDSVFASGQSNSTTCSSGPANSGGHVLPATKGGAGEEQHLSVQGPAGDGGDLQKHYALTNVPTAAQNGFAGGGGALATADKTEEQYYINMRWRYVLWNWNGTSTSSGAKEDVAFYQKHPRVLVTNPRTGKSVVTAAIEAGPAPWTGTSFSAGNPPSYWQTPQDGTPTQYRGRVAGLSPEAWLALDAAERTADGGGDDLLYSWADPSAPLGPTSSMANSATACAASSASFIKNIVFSGSPITPTAVVLHFTASPDPSMETTVSALRSNPTCGSGGCSVQLTIDGDGKVYQLMDPLNSLAYHAIGINQQAIGIEIGGANEAQLLADTPQFNAVVSTVIQLCQMYNIPVDGDINQKMGVMSHQDEDVTSYGGHQGKIDPGETYTQNVKTAVRAALTPKP